MVGTVTPSVEELNGERVRMLMFDHQVSEQIVRQEAVFWSTGRINIAATDDKLRAWKVAQATQKRPSQQFSLDPDHPLTKGCSASLGGCDLTAPDLSDHRRDGVIRNAEGFPKALTSDEIDLLRRKEPDEIHYSADEIKAGIKKHGIQYGRLIAVEKLIAAAEPFLSDRVVDETDGTIPLMNALETAIEEAKKQFGL